MMACIATSLHQQMYFCHVQGSPRGEDSGSGWHWEQAW